MNFTCQVIEERGIKIHNTVLSMYVSQARLFLEDMREIKILNNYKGHMDKNKGGLETGGRWGWLGWWGGVRGETKLYLNNNKIQKYLIKKKD